MLVRTSTKHSIRCSTNPCWEQMAKADLLIFKEPLKKSTPISSCTWPPSIKILCSNLISQYIQTSSISRLQRKALRLSFWASLWSKSCMQLKENSLSLRRRLLIASFGLIRSKNWFYRRLTKKYWRCLMMNRWLRIWRNQATLPRRSRHLYSRSIGRSKHWKGTETNSKLWRKEEHNSTFWLRTSSGSSMSTNFHSNGFWNCSTLSSRPRRIWTLILIHWSIWTSDWPSQPIRRYVSACIKRTNYWWPSCLQSH